MPGPADQQDGDREEGTGAVRGDREHSGEGHAGQVGRDRVLHEEGVQDVYDRDDRIKTLQQSSGVYAIDVDLQTILEASKNDIPLEIASIICSFIQIRVVFIAASVVDKMDRKLLIFSSLGCTAEGAYFYLQDVAKADVSGLSWLPITRIMLYLLMNSIGLYTLLYILTGELFATNIKAIAA